MNLCISSHVCTFVYLCLWDCVRAGVRTRKCRCNYMRACESAPVKSTFMVSVTHKSLPAAKHPFTSQRAATLPRFMAVHKNDGVCGIGGLVLGARLESGRSRYEPGLRWALSGSSHASDLNIGIPVAPLPGAWCYRVSPGTGRPGVSIL